MALVEGQQDIFVATKVSTHEKTMLPAGMYQAKLNLKNNRLNIPNFKFDTADSHLAGSAVIDLPTDKRQLKWNAVLAAKNF